MFFSQFGVVVNFLNGKFTAPTNKVTIKPIHKPKLEISFEKPETFASTWNYIESHRKKNSRKAGIKFLFISRFNCAKNKVGRKINNTTVLLVKVNFSFHFDSPLVGVIHSYLLFECTKKSHSHALQLRKELSSDLNSCAHACALKISLHPHE